MPKTLYNNNSNNYKDSLRQKVVHSQIQHINCIQINLQHSRSAMYNLTQLVTELKTDIAILQEPYLFDNKPTGLPLKHRLFYSSKGKCRSAILVINRSFDALMIHQLSDGDTTVLEVRSGKSGFIIASFYFDILRDIEVDLRKLKQVVQIAKGRGLVTGIDTNARSRLWYDSFTNKRGKILEEFLIENKLLVMNEDNGRPTFQSNRGASNIDLTICNHTLLKEIKNWDNSFEESCSDHSIITFTIGYSHTSQHINLQGIRYIVKKEDFTSFNEHFIREVKKHTNCEAYDLVQLDNIMATMVSEQQDPEVIVNTFQTIISETCNKTFKCRSPTMKEINTKSVPWWSSELTIMRKLVNAQRRRFQRTTGNEELRESRKIIYQQGKRNYQNAIKQNKFNSWKEYCNITTSSNPWNAAYKIASGKIRNTSILSTLKKSDGTYTEGLADTMNYVIDQFTQEDNENTDSAYHIQIRHNIEEPPNTNNDKSFTTNEIGDIIENMNSKKAPGDDGVTADLLQQVFSIVPTYVTAVYNKCLDVGIFPSQWKKAKIILIVKPGKESSDKANKFRPISLINVAAKVLEKLFINRIMHHLYANDLLNKNQFGFRPQTSTIDAVMLAKDFIEDSLANKESVAMISLDVEGAFNSAWWPGILNSLKHFRCPKNIYNLTRSYLSDRVCFLAIKSTKIERKLSKGCPQGSCCGPGLWNVQYDSLLNLQYKTGTKVIAFADDVIVLIKGKNVLEIENKANIELNKISKWAKLNKISFNRDKTKIMLISRNKPKNKPVLNTYINNGRIEQTNKMKYLGILIDERFKFNQHIEYITEKCIKLIHALAKSAKINWGLNSDVTKIIYKGAILPLISYGIPVWIESLNTKYNIMKIKRVQRLINIKIARAFRTTSHEALCILTGLTPINIELSAISKLFYITRGIVKDAERYGSLDTEINYREWPHPSLNVKLHEKVEDLNYSVQIFTDGSKTEAGVGAGIVIYSQEEAVQHLRYRLGSRCSNNQAEQLAILKALQELRNHDNVTGKLAAVHSDSKITLDLLRNNSKHSVLIEEIKINLRYLTVQNWIIHFQWVKAHVGNEGNEIADQLAKQATSCSELETTYDLVPISTVKRDLREESIEAWEKEWSNTTNGKTTKAYFPSVRSRLYSNIKLTHNITAMTTGHGKFGEYFHRFKIIEDPTCVCGKNSQSVDHVLWECELLQTAREVFRREVINAGGRWPPKKCDLVIKYLTFYAKFVNNIDFDLLQIID